MGDFGNRGAMGVDRDFKLKLHSFQGRRRRWIESLIAIFVLSSKR